MSARPALIMGLLVAIALYAQSDEVSLALGDLVEGDADVNGNTEAFLAMIRAAEGTAGANGYYTLYGGQFFLEMDTHPAVRTYGEFNGRPGLDYTTAAGAFQITETTWRRLSAKLGLYNFSPETQDAMALELIREKGALDDVREGRFDSAVAKLGGVWASLPSSTVPQPHRSFEFVRQAYQAAGGTVATA